MSQSSPTDNVPVAAAAPVEAPIEKFEAPEVAETQELFEAPEVVEAPEAVEDPTRPKRRKKS